MKRGRLREEQIIGALREQETGVKTGEPAQARDLGSHPVQVEGQVRRHGCVRSQAAADAGRREPQAEEAAGGVDAGQLRALVT
jgi:hypothetical protein